MDAGRSEGAESEQGAASEGNHEMGKPDTGTKMIIIIM
jgi:hypothetical protein